MAQNVNINVNVNGKQAGANIDKITKSLGKLSTQSNGIGQTNRALTSTGIISKTAASGVKRLAGSIGGLVAVYAGFTAVVNATRNLIDFNKAVAEVQTIANLNKKPLGELKESLIGISSATGKSATEATRTFYQIQSAGITDVVEAQKTLQASLKLSVGSLADAETTTLALTKAMAVYGNTLKGPTEASDILFRGVELGQTRMEDLAMAIPQVLGPAKNLGISFEDLVGAVASFSKRAGSTSLAVTQLNSILSGLAKKQGEAGKILGENAHLFSVQSLRAKGLTKFLADLTNAVGGSSTALFKLFGRKEAVVGTLSAYADGFEDLGETIVKARDNTGAADRAFQRILKSIGGQLDIFREKASNIFLRFGIRGEDAIVSALESLNKGMAKLENNVSAIIIQIKALLITVGVVAFTTFAIRGIAALKSIQLQFIQLRATSVAQLTGVRIGLKGFIASVAAAKFAVISFKAVATFGLSIVLDVIIVKLLEMEQQLNGWGRVWDRFVLPAKIALKNISLFIDKAILKFNELRLKGVEALTIGIANLASMAGITVKTEGFKNLKTIVNESKMAVEETTGELARLEGQLDAIIGKKGAGDGSLLFRPPPPPPTFSIPGDFDLGGAGVLAPVPGVPDPKMVDDKLNQVKSSVVAFNAEMNMIREQQKALEAEESLQIRIAQGEATESDFERLRNIELEKVNIKFDAELEKTKLIADGQKRNEEIQKIGAKREFALDKVRAKQSITLAKQTQALKLKSEQQNVALIASVGNLGAAIAKDGSKEQFLITKAAALAGSIVSTQLAYMQALATPPGPPYTIPLATKIGIIGGINTAAIAATAIKGFRTGGIVGGTPTGGRDSVLASVEPREGIFTRAQQSRLFQLANGEQPNNQGGVMSAIDKLANAIMNQQTSIEIDGRQVALAVRDQRLAGVSI